MRTAYLDCFAGISGDMFLGALLDAGVPAHVLENATAALGLDASISIEKVDRNGISAIKVHVFEGKELAETDVAPFQAHAHSHEGSHEHSHEHSHAPSHLHEHLHPREETRKHRGSDGHSSAHEHPYEYEHAQPHEHTQDEVKPHAHEQAHAHNNARPHVHGRSLTIIRELINASLLAESVKSFAIHTFELLGHSEAKIHDVPVEEIHFHEVGAVDAIVDIVAASAGIAYLEEAGPLAWFCSPINVGGGMVECAHGTFPVPAPATADLLRNMPTYSAHVQKELVTPTGAALLHALAPTFGMQPRMRVDSIGYGAGTRNPDRFPNVLRLSLGTSETASNSMATHSDTEATVMVLETALDDATPQLLAHVAEQLLEAGALDVMLTPVVMKKGRPATLLTALCDLSQTPALEVLLLRETTTLGIRKHREERSCLDRRHVTVPTQFGDIRIKVGSLDGEELNAMPEFEDCRAAARRHAIPLKQVQQAALAAYACSPAR